MIRDLPGRIGLVPAGAPVPQEAWRRAQEELTAPAQSPHGAAVPH